jgi:hypothetical protein
MDVRLKKNKYMQFLHLRYTNSAQSYVCGIMWLSERQLLMVLFLIYDIEKSYANVGMPERA